MGSACCSAVGPAGTTITRTRDHRPRAPRGPLTRGATAALVLPAAATMPADAAAMPWPARARLRHCACLRKISREAHSQHDGADRRGAVATSD